jgi:hypothetical protein
VVAQLAASEEGPSSVSADSSGSGMGRCLQGRLRVMTVTNSGDDG